MSQKEGQIALAMHAFKEGQIATLKEACRLYGAPYSTVLGRVKGAIAKRDSGFKVQKLTPEEEATLEEWILSMDTRGLSVRQKSITQMANLLLQKRSESSRVQVGVNWAHNFIQRHDSLRTKYSRKYDYQRAKCEDPSIIRAWFRLVQNIVGKYGILADDIYNFDETGFQMGIIATARVVTGSERKGRPVLLQPGNREWVTAIASICADGWSIPTMIVFEGKVHISTWYTEQLPKDWVIGLSDTGWTNDDLGLIWLKDVFEKYTRDRTKGVYRLLILDGHGSHSTPEFDLFCREHNIITLCMPPHSSHLLQPLDVGCFSALKQYYGQEVEKLIRVGTLHIDKPDFLLAYIAAQNKTFIENTVRSAFAASGLVPYNPDRVLERLNTRLRTPTPPLILMSSPSTWVPETPRNTLGVDRQAETIRRSIQRRIDVLSSPTDIALGQLIKGCKMAMQAATVLSEENKQLRAESDRKKRKKTMRRQYIATGGVLTVQEGLQLVQRDNNIVESSNADQANVSRLRALRKCSKCRSTEHTARTCSVSI